MDDDLDLPAAFDSVRSAVNELAKIHPGPLSKEQSDRLLAALKKTDEVFAFVF